MPVRYGIVGFGGIAENRIAREGFGLDTARFSGTTDARLIAACDLVASRRQSALDLGLKWEDSYEKLLEYEDIDAVIIATNNRSHAPLARKALLAGKHVFLEKPAGISLEEVQELIELAEKRGLSIGVDHMMTKNQYNIAARDLIRQDGIGEVQTIVLHMEFPYGFTPEEAATWRCSVPEELGGPIGDVGSHCLYMAEFLLDDEIESVQCVVTPKHRRTAVEDGAVIHALTKKGTPCTMRVAFDQMRGPVEELIGNLGYEVYGTKGMISTRGTMFQLSGHDDEPAPIQLWTICHGEERTACHVGSIPNIYQEQIKEHAQSILTGKRLDGREALHNLELILLAYASAEHGGNTKSISYHGGNA